MMDQKQFLEILKVAGKLKSNTRHNWIEPDRKESIADHSYRMALMAMLLTGVEEFREVDMNRVIRMALIHDLGEAFTGDIPTFEKNANDEHAEDAIFARWVADFPEPQRTEWQALLEEMGELKSVEARVYKALDKLEAIISHDEAELSSWLPLEYELQLTYAVKNTAFSPYLDELRKQVDAWTHEKIAQEAEQRLK